MAKYAEHPDEDYKMTFGKHIGLPLKRVPDDYLLYLWGENGKGLYVGSPLRRYIKDNLLAIVSNVNRSRTYNKIDLNGIFIDGVSLAQIKNTT